MDKDFYVREKLFLIRTKEINDTKARLIKITY